jgi:CubicO group peptidase (beta-lactamase class C family)
VAALDQLDEWPEPPAAVGVLVRQADDAPVEVVATRGDLDSECEWASVTKLLVSLAVLAAADAPDAPEADPNTMLGLGDAAGPPGATIRHLLAHASGLGPEGLDPLTAPGRRRIYSNSGFEVLAGELERRTGRSWPDELERTVTGPCGLGSTWIAPGGSAASGAVGTPGDLISLAGELLAPTILSPDLFATAVEVAFPGLPGVVPGVGRYEHCDWGLGFELKGSKVPHWTAPCGSPRTFGHFGRSGAFVWVDPEARVAAICGGGAVFGPWAVGAWSRFSEAVLEEFSP